MNKEIEKNFSNAQNAPRDAHPLLYATWLCENRIATPATQSNLAVISDSISAIAKSKFKDDKWKHPLFTAFVWLDKQIEYAQMSRIPVNHLFFLNGEYNQVNKPETRLSPFVACTRCNEGWRYQMKDGVSTGRVEPCECRQKWIEENRRSQ